MDTEIKDKIDKLNETITTMTTEYDKLANLVLEFAQQMDTMKTCMVNFEEKLHGHNFDIIQLQNKFNPFIKK
jgi:hypothetical protein